MNRQPTLVVVEDILDKNKVVDREDQIVVDKCREKGEKFLVNANRTSIDKGKKEVLKILNPIPQPQNPFP